MKLAKAVINSYDVTESSPSAPRHLDIGICWLASPHPNPEFHRHFFVEAATSWRGTANWITHNRKGLYIKKTHTHPHHSCWTSPQERCLGFQTPNKKRQETQSEKKQHHHQKCSITSSPPLTNTKITSSRPRFPAECLPYQQSYGFSLCHHSLERWSRHMGLKKTYDDESFCAKWQTHPIHSNTTLIHRKDRMEWQWFGITSR